jgi:hypothetical protein
VMVYEFWMLSASSTRPDYGEVTLQTSQDLLNLRTCTDDDGRLVRAYLVHKIGVILPPCMKPIQKPFLYPVLAIQGYITQVVRHR